MFSIQDYEFTANIPLEKIHNISIDFYATPTTAWQRRVCANKVIEFAGWQKPDEIWVTGKIDKDTVKRITKKTNLPVTVLEDI